MLVHCLGQGSKINRETMYKHTVLLSDARLYYTQLSFECTSGFLSASRLQSSTVVIVCRATTSKTMLLMHCEIDIDLQTRGTCYT